jgi:hypothetical protein
VVEAVLAVVFGLTSMEADGVGHSARGSMPLASRMARGGLKVARKALLHKVGEQHFC